MLTYLFQVTSSKLSFPSAAYSIVKHFLAHMVSSTERCCHLTVIVQVSPAGIQHYSYIQNMKNV